MSIIKQFVEPEHIDLPAIRRMTERVMVVGVFSARGKTAPSITLFSNRADAQEYAAAANKYSSVPVAFRSLTYDGFVQAVDPSLIESTEDADPDNFVYFPAQRLQAPVDAILPRFSQEGKHYWLQHLNDENWFMRRGAQTTEHKALQALHRRPGLGPLPANLLRDANTLEERGREVFKQLKQDVGQASEFLVRVPELVYGFLSLLAAIPARELFPYAIGGALPVGMVQMLVDHLFDDQDDASITPADLRELDYSFNDDKTARIWSTVRDSPRRMELLADTMNAYRHALLGISGRYTQRVTGAHTLEDFAQRAVADQPELADRFRRAWQGMRGIRHLLKSRILPSFLLGWIVDEAFQLDELEGLTDDERAKKITSLVLDSGLQGKIAPPVRRLAAEDRAEYADDLAKSHEQIVIALTAEEADYERMLGQMSPEVARQVEALRADGELVDGLGVYKRSGSLTAYNAAMSHVIRGALMRKLLRSPLLEVAALRSERDAEFQALIFEAAAYSEANAAALQALAEKHRDSFEAAVVGEGGRRNRTEDAEVVTTEILKDFVVLFGKQNDEMTEMCRRLIPSMAVRESLGTTEDSVYPTTPAPNAQAATVSEGVRVTMNASRPAARTLEVVEQSFEAAGVSVGPDAAKPDTGPEPDQDGDSLSETASPPGDSNATPGADEADDAPARSEAADVDLAELLLQTMGHSAHEPVTLDSGFESSVRSLETAYHEGLSYVYQAYNDNPHEQSFRARVEKLTLANVMLQMNDVLGLGVEGSHVYRLILDLLDVEARCKEDGVRFDAGEFLKRKSLTEYFDDAVLRDAGLLALLEHLKELAVTGLYSSTRFVSDIWGMKYMMSQLERDRRKEILVFDGSAESFIEWIREDMKEASGGLVRAATFKKSDHGKKALLPSLVYLTRSAFKMQESAADWAKRNLNDESLLLDDDSAFQYVMPPILLDSGEPPSNGAAWRTTGQELAGVADAVHSPLCVVGPDLPLNVRGDGFATSLPAGFVMLTYLMGGSVDGLCPDALGQTSVGRFRVLSSARATLNGSLFNAVWDANHGVPLAADIYLFLVQLLLTISVGPPDDGKKGDDQKVTELFRYLDFDPNQGPWGTFQKLRELGPLLPNRKDLRSIGLATSETGKLVGLRVSTNRKGGELQPLDRGKSANWFREVTNFKWFNKALSRQIGIEV